MVAELITLAVIVFAGVAEWLHWRRCRRVAPLIFGPGQKAFWWVRLSPFIRIGAIGLLAWGLVTLLFVDPKIYRAKQVAEEEIRHVVLVLDVSPSMRLKDAGPDKDQSRSKRVSEIMRSFFKRVVMEQVRISIVAFYTDAKPVVVDTKDIEVVRNVLEDLPMYQAFDSGKTQLFDGIKEAVNIVKPWRRKSATLLILSDGDTVPPTGMPKMPPSVSTVLVVGVGDPKSGKFIDGYQSRQDVATLRQVAKRLRGTYHNGNEKHISSATLEKLMRIESPGKLSQLTKREYALIGAAVGSCLLALLPLALTYAGTNWRPGVHDMENQAAT